MYTTSAALIDALQEAGVSFIFANLGSDHPALMEAMSQAKAEGRMGLELVTCPNEMVGLSCAQGYAQVTGEAQAVLVHVDCGTLGLAGAVHNVARGRVPVFIFAGLSPSTQEGEAKGSRNEFIHWIQDSFDQAGIVREYMKYSHEVRNGGNVRQIVHRSMQLAHSDPKGPVYLTSTREVMEAEIQPGVTDLSRWRPVAPGALADGDAASIVGTLAAAKRPLVVTSYVGRNPEAVPELVSLCRRLGVGVLESVPNCMNFPHGDDLYQGAAWNESGQSPVLAEADVVLVLDSDVPWIPTVSRPSPDARILHIDVDPLKRSMPLWYIEAHGSYQADALTALKQMNAHAEDSMIDPRAVEARNAHYAARHRERQARLVAAESPPSDVITPEFLTACLRRQLGPDAIVLSEGITNYAVICDHMAPAEPGGFFNSGGGSLGWSGGAAIGAKLARPDKMVAALTGDGSFMFSVPSSVHWMARRYKTPFLQVIYNNGGWKAPKMSALALHPDGAVSRDPDLGVSLEPAPDYCLIAAAAGGAWGRKVDRPEDLEAVIAEAVRVVLIERRAAVLDVVLPGL